MESSKKKILITGITGYVGAHVGKVFLERNDGRYEIRATVRNLKNTHKTDALKESYGEELFSQIEFVQADLNDAASIRNAFKDIWCVVHVASSLQGSVPVSDSEMIRTAQHGTLNIIAAAKANRVKKLIVTSSQASIIGGLWKKDQEPPARDYYTEKDFAPLQGADAYSQSKIYQEALLRDFIKSDEGKSGIEILTLHPMFVIGPTLIRDENSSVLAIAKFLKGEIPGVPRLMSPVVDVRDVAEAHFIAMEREGLHGQRIILSQESLWWKDIAAIMMEEFAQYGYKIHDKEFGYWLFKLASFFLSQINFILPQLDHEIYCVNDRSREILGMTYSRDIKQTFHEMGHSIIDKGIVPDLRPKH